MSAGGSNQKGSNREAVQDRHRRAWELYAELVVAPINATSTHDHLARRAYQMVDAFDAVRASEQT